MHVQNTRIWRCKSFKADREVVVNLPRSGPPTTSAKDSNFDKIKKLVLENRRKSHRELARDVNLKKKLFRYESLCNVMNFGYLNASPHDRLLKGSNLTCRCARVLVQIRNQNYRTSNLNAWYSSVWLFPAIEDQIANSIKAFWVNCLYKRKFGEGTKGHTPICRRKMYGELDPALKKLYLTP